jgi:hypothetical protein
MLISYWTPCIGFIELWLGFVLGPVFYFSEFVPRYRRDLVSVRFSRSSAISYMTVVKNIVKRCQLLVTRTSTRADLVGKNFSHHCPGVVFTMWKLNEPIIVPRNLQHLTEMSNFEVNTLFAGTASDWLTTNLWTSSVITFAARLGNINSIFSQYMRPAISFH